MTQYVVNVTFWYAMHNTIMSDKPTKKVNTKVGGKINQDQVLLYALQGKGVTEIATLMQCDKAYISRMLSPMRHHIDGYLAFKNDPAALWEYQEYRVLSAVNDSDINKARLAEKATFSGIARDKVRLQRGQSTSNISAITSIIQAVHERKPQPIVVSDDPVVSIDSPVTGSTDIPGQLPAPMPEIEGGRGELVADSVIIPPYDPAVE